MVLRPLHGNRPHLLCDQARQTFMDSHTKGADTLAAKPYRGRQDQVRSIGLDQIDRTHIGFKPLGNQRDHVHQRLGRLAALFGEVSNLFQSQNVARVPRFRALAHALHSPVIRFPSDARLSHRVYLYFLMPSTLSAVAAELPLRRCNPVDADVTSPTPGAMRYPPNPVHPPNSISRAHAKSNPNC